MDNTWWELFKNVEVVLKPSLLLAVYIPSISFSLFVYVCRKIADIYLYLSVYLAIDLPDLLSCFHGTSRNAASTTG